MKNTHEFLTTNIIVNKHKIDLSLLKSKYKLVRYQVPEQFRHIERNDKYFLLHAEYKEQFERPYYFFSFDKLHDKEHTTFALYALLDKAEEIPELSFSFLTNRTEHKLIDFDDEKLELHVLLKVLLSLYVYKQSEQQRICQHKFYILGKNKTEFLKTCVKIDIEQAKQSKNGIIEFYLKPASVDFVKIEQADIKDHYPKLYPFFEGGIVKQGLNYLRQLKPSEVKNFSGEIYRLKKTSIYNKPNLEWHTGDEAEQKNTRGYITFHFQKKFVEHLQDILGDEAVCRKVVANAKEYKPKKKTELVGFNENGLPVKMLEQVYVFDNRLKELETSKNLNKLKTIDFIEKLNAYSKENKLDVEFVAVSENELNDKDFAKPVLVLQDICGDEIARRNDNDELQKEFLGKVGFDDPYQIFYNKYKHFPKQSLNINTNSVDKKKNAFNRNSKPRYNKDTYRKYFEYELFDYDYSNLKSRTPEYDKAKLFEYKINVCLNELLFKHIIINKLPILDMHKLASQLPWLSGKGKNFAFMHNKTFMSIEDNRIKFSDLETKAGKLERNKILENLGVDWYQCVDDFERKHYLKTKEKEKKEVKRKNTRFIFSQNLAMEIEEPEERVLFNFDKCLKLRKKIGTSDGIVGIWYEPSEMLFTIGFHQAPRFEKIPKSNKVRKLHIYQGDGTFDMENFMETMSVSFVRNKQYTVYPYPFDLIRLYNEIKEKE